MIRNDGERKKKGKEKGKGGITRSGIVQWKEMEVVVVG